MTVARSAFIRFGQELLQQSQIYGVNELHKFCPVFQLRGRDPREVFHVQGMLCFMLQKRNKKSLAFKIIRLFYAVDRAVGRGPAACPVPAESQIIYPDSKNKAFENIDCVFRRSVRQFDSVNGRNRIPPNIRAVISLCFSEKRMIAVRFKHRFKLFGQTLFICIRHIQECPQLFDQLACRIRFR